MGLSDGVLGLQFFFRSYGKDVEKMCTISPKIVCISVVRMGDIQVSMLGMMLDLLCVLPLCRLSIARDVCASSATCPQACGEQILSEWRDGCAFSATCPQVCGEQILSE